MEFIKANGAEYACKAVVTGVDSISFSMEGQAVADIEKAFDRSQSLPCQVEMERFMVHMRTCLLSPQPSMRTGR